MITLTTPIKELKGIGPKKAAAYRRLGIETVEQLLHYYPSGYTFAPPVGGPLREGEPATIVGTVTDVRNPRHDFSAVLDYGINVYWFGGAYLRQSVFKGSRLMVSGVVKNGGFTNPEWRVLKPYETPDPSLMNTVTYPVTAGITSKDIGRLVRQVPDEIWGRQPPHLFLIHNPLDQETVDKCRQFFKHRELFFMQLALATRQARREQEPPTVRCLPPKMNPAQYFPFEFTNDQRQAIDEIMGDLCSPRAMNRLLQGDVGSGKTAVAAYAAIVMAFNGGQTAILCPTEILARQHYETIKGYFERAGVSHSLVTATAARNLDVAMTRDIIVGTTAMLADNIRYHNLGLVIVDELHKFGVEQRAALRRNGNPHVLSMSATPIPRTLAMTVFGDLDVSTIRSMPPGRKPVYTRRAKNLDHVIWRQTGVGPANGYPDVTPYTVIRDELAAGHQVYVVCPRIEALDDEMQAVEDVWQEYSKLFPEARVAYLHGRQHSLHKDQVVESFRDGTLDILVATTVIEVGVDCPNATVMVIEGAERFGLAQLWQLRGRVGRGKDQSYCFLLSDSDSTEARARLRAMEKATSGFEIAEQDLILRGPGDLLDTTQHGLPRLRIADLVADQDILCEARKEARELVAKGPLPADMQAELERCYGDKLYLADA